MTEEGKKAGGDGDGGGVYCRKEHCVEYTRMYSAQAFAYLIDKDFWVTLFVLAFFCLKKTFAYAFFSFLIFPTLPQYGLAHMRTNLIAIGRTN